MFKDKITKLKLLLNSNILNLNHIRNEIDYLSNFMEYNEYEYLNKLLYPEKDRGGKIPSQVPIPTTSFRYDFNDVIQTNAYGVFHMMFNPFFLANDSFLKKYTLRQDYWRKVDDEYVSYTRWVYTTDYFSTFWFNNKPAADGETELEYGDNRFRSRDAHQVIPDIYNRYRLVSGFIEARYLDSLDISSGIIGGGITNESFPVIATKYVAVNNPADPYPDTDPAFSLQYPTMMKYGDFNYVRQLPYSKENSILDGIRMIYYPVDNYYSEFVPIFNGSGMQAVSDGKHSVVPMFIVDSSYFKSSFNWIVYAQNAPPYCRIKIHVCCNFECLLDQAYMDFIPTSTYYGAIPTNVFYETIKKIKLKAII